MRLVEKESYLLELARYIVLNPVRARMVRAAKDWPWSSYRLTAGLDGVMESLEIDWILSIFSRNREKAQRTYREFVSKGVNQPAPWESLLNQIYLGSEAFMNKAQGMLERDKDLSEIPAPQKRPIPKSLAEYDKQATDRDHAITLAHQSGDYSMKEIGSYFGLHYSRVSRIIGKRLAKGKT